MVLAFVIYERVQILIGGYMSFACRQAHRISATEVALQLTMQGTYV